MLPPRASPQAKLGATNVIEFTSWTTKAEQVVQRLAASQRNGGKGMIL